MAEKDATLRGFVNGDIEVVFATDAFGMGIDIPDIGGGIHFLLPEPLEQLLPRGRPCRDDKRAFGILLYTTVNAGAPRYDSRGIPDSGGGSRGMDEPLRGRTGLPAHHQPMEGVSGQGR
jgi:hypothetical protein